MVAWSWSPSLWGDELATLKAVTSFDSMVETLRHRDAVFLPYYLLMYGWTRLVPPTGGCSCLRRWAWRSRPGC
jgi:hypothetical protein